MIHPSKHELNLFIDNGLDDAPRVAEISRHLEECEFCRQYWDNYRLYCEAGDEAAKGAISQAAWRLADRLYQQALSGKIVPLQFLPTDGAYERMLLAADSDSDFAPPVINLATLYSEEPEMVLRVMRDTDRNEDYLQLIGAEAELAAQVMIQIPELDREFITDAEGRVSLAGVELDDVEQLKWQIKLPDASFSLQPLHYDPDHTESAKEVSLQTDSGDRIEVIFEDKTEGKQIVIRVLELDGKTDFAPVRVAISQQETRRIKNVAANEPIEFGLIDPQQEINIRLFQ